ncbi:MAG: FecR domain-containing protein, partial [Caulobacterales bacterium]|nr:FecR domain-containing protein [Caulobacterales bacterium]
RPAAPPAPVAQEVASAVGEQKEVRLADGSHIILNTNTRLSVDYTAEVRGVALAAGEAFFDVAHDPARPFHIATPSGVVTAIGTAFSVRVEHDETEVIVADGAVEVRVAPSPAVSGGSDAAAALAMARIAEAPAGGSAVIGVGEQAVFALAASAIVVHAQDDMERRLSWREGVVVFEDDPLHEVIDEISRYTDIDVVIDDEELKTLRVGGSFSVGEIDSFLDALVLAFGIELQRTDEKVVLAASGR